MAILALEKDSFISQTSSVTEQRTASLTVVLLPWASTSATMVKTRGSFVKVYSAVFIHNMHLLTVQHVPETMITQTLDS